MAREQCRDEAGTVLAGGIAGEGLLPLDGVEGLGGGHLRLEHANVGLRRVGARPVPFDDAAAKDRFGRHAIDDREGRSLGLGEVAKRSEERRVGKECRL